MFQFSGFAHLSVYYVFNIVGCPIQVFTDHIVCANPRNFSQLITPFIASESLGIPHTPLFCLLYRRCIATSLRIVINHNTCSFYFLLFLISICQWTFALRNSNFLNSKFQQLEFVISFLKFAFKLVENNGVEPLTSCVQGRRSSQLS